MKFAQFIKNHKEDITNEWVKFAEDNISGVNKLQIEEVRDHIKQMLDRIVKNMEISETDVQQEKKSKGIKICSLVKVRLLTNMVNSGRM